MTARIFIWVGHPRHMSLSHGLADAYERGAKQNGAQIRRMHLHDMDFDPDLTDGYHVEKELETCLKNWQENILWANHLCWAYPQWWAGMPAKMKGVIDRAYLPGFAMNYPEDKILWEALLKGRSGDILMTSDAPPWFDLLYHGRIAKTQAQNLVMRYAGIKPVRTLQFGPVKNADEAQIAKWKQKAEKRGQQIAHRLRGAA